MPVICVIRHSGQRNLIAHQRIHIGEGHYVCDMCNKAFSDKSILIKHTRIH